ncbi:MAG: BolA family transcriptional regulator [Chromatiales bacterium]|jgi:BolA protein|nr:BolA family transcriptional regulator [Chromatiales bacterium]MDP6151241.1 BolA family protein [Gammaproteobacteria bacterium]HJP05067.1 BolA family protein [Gammaproteobacteria bacterium]
MNEERIAQIDARLRSAFEPSSLEIEDQSHMHAGHAGAKAGKGHFRVAIVSNRFTGKSPLQRHRLIYEALGGLMESDIHALTIEASSEESA